MPRFIDREETRRLVDEEGGQLVEVLPRSQYDQAHIPDAISLPLKEFSTRSLSRLDRDRPVIVYCNNFL